MQAMTGKQVDADADTSAQTRIHRQRKWESKKRKGWERKVKKGREQNDMKNNLVFKGPPDSGTVADITH